MTDKELLKEYVDGNLDAFQIFYDRYKDSLYTFLKNRSGEGADDLFQETFIKFIDAIARREVHNPKAYLFQIAMNLVRNSGRKAKVIQLDTDIDIPDEEEESRLYNYC